MATVEHISHSSIAKATVETPGFIATGTRC
jgi:hypothetical protein